MEKLVIEGGTVKTVTETVMKEVSTKRFIEEMAKRVPMDSGLLPRNCLYVKKFGNNLTYLVEIPATMVSVKFHMRGSSDMKEFVISIPFTQFFINSTVSGAIGNSYVSVTKAPVTSMKDTIYIPPYCNIHDGGTGKICTGSMKVPNNVETAKKVNYYVSSFFESGFNTDLSPQVPEIFVETLKVLSTIGGSQYLEKMFEEWSDFTKKDRFFAISKAIEYKPRKEKIEELMERCVGGA